MPIERGDVEIGIISTISKMKSECQTKLNINYQVWHKD